MNRKHGLSDTKLYRRWYSMVGRCKYPSHTSWKWYGAKGVTVATEWLSFETFMKDMGNPPFSRATIERKSNSGPYSKENCYWATEKEQGRNRSNNLILTHQGKSQSAAAWADEIGIDMVRLHERKQRGWTDEEAITTPLRGLYLELNGQRKLAKQWANDIGIKYGTLWWRYKQGWPLAKILSPNLKKNQYH